MNLLLLILTMLGGRGHVVLAGQPTGDLVPGDVLIELDTDRAYCDQHGGVWVAGTCYGVDF